MTHKSTILKNDIIEKRAYLIREYAEKCEAFVGIYHKSRLRSLHSQLTGLKVHAYHRALKNDDDLIAWYTHLILEDIKLDQEPVSLNPNIIEGSMFRVYWRPDPIIAANVKMGFPGRRRTIKERLELDDAYRYLRWHL